MTQSIKIDPYGFREYDARWIYEKDINEQGITNLGKGLGTQIKEHTKKKNPRVIVGHDYRSYSEKIKSALKVGLVSTGCFIEDVGLSLSPMVYFAQFNLNADAVAMVTASHNENGWTGVKMGIKKGLTHAPEEMKELKEITLNQNFTKGEGNEKQIKNFDKVYKEDLIDKNKLRKKIKAVVACGNGTAGIFAPDILRGIGCEVIELDCNLDWNFPKYNPNPGLDCILENSNLSYSLIQLLRTQYLLVYQVQKFLLCHYHMQRQLLFFFLVYFYQLNPLYRLYQNFLFVFHYLHLW